MDTLKVSQNQNIFISVNMPRKIKTRQNETNESKARQENKTIIG